MATTITRSLTALLALSAVTWAAPPASAMSVASRGASTSIAQQTNWSDRVRGRTSSSTPGLGYGWLYGDRAADPHYRRGRGDPRGVDYDRSEPVPYGYDEGAY